MVKALETKSRGPVYKTTGWSFILPRSIKWVPGISGNLVVKSKLPPLTLRLLNPIHKKGP